MNRFTFRSSLLLRHLPLWAALALLVPFGIGASFVRCVCTSDSDYNITGVTARRPLVVINGQTQQLPTVDFISSVGGISTNATTPANNDVQTSTLTTSTQETAAGQVRRTGVISPPSFSAENNWNPTGLSTASVINISTAAAAGITGIVAQPTGTEITLRNTGSNDVTLSNANALSDPANRFNVGATQTLKAGASFTIRYTGSDWTMVGMAMGASFQIPTFTVSTVGTIGGLHVGAQTYTTTGTSNDIVLNSSATLFQYQGSGNATFTGFFGCSTGRMLIIQNRVGFDVTLANETGSGAGRQLKNPGGVNVVLKGIGTAIYYCDGIQPIWQLASVTSTQISFPTTFSSTTNRGTITLAAGTGTATVTAGAVCTCTDTTAVNAVQCAVSSTTLTATGTGTDVIAYHCM